MVVSSKHVRLKQGMTQGQFLIGIQLTSEFSFSKIGCNRKVKESNVSYYLHLARGE